MWIFPDVVDVDANEDPCGHGWFRLVAHDPAGEPVIVDLSEFARDVRSEDGRVTVTLEGVRLAKAA